MEIVVSYELSNNVVKNFAETGGLEVLSKSHLTILRVLERVADVDVSDITPCIFLAWEQPTCGQKNLIFNNRLHYHLIVRHMRRD